MPINSGQQTQSATLAPKWGNPTVVFLIGLGSLIVLGGTRFAPVVIAFLVAVIVYWVLPSS